jgi:hypothetical protein
VFDHTPNLAHDTRDASSKLWSKKLKKDPVEEVKVVIGEIEAQLSALRRSLRTESLVAPADATSAHDKLRKALKLVTESEGVVACW